MANQSLIRQYFREIAAIPHPSGAERRLAEFLARQAREHGLTAEVDSVGNVRIDRPGEKDGPVIILQGHTDMVPMAAPGVSFDFHSEPIRLVEKDGWISTGGKTTLGADDGIGIAAALAILYDRELHCGPLRAVFTVSEETGMHGANALDPAWLKGDYLLNLDSEDEGVFICGCAGGSKLDVTLSAKREPVPAGLIPCRIALTGLAGGHSGTCIHGRRGNAIKYLASFLSAHPGFRISAFSGGTVDNAIPQSSYADGWLLPAQLDSMRDACHAYRKILETECDLPQDAALEITASDSAPGMVWQNGFAVSVLHALANAASGVTQFSKAHNVPETSLNLASVHSDADGSIRIVTSLRSLIDAERLALERRITDYWTAVDAQVEIRSPYSAWTPSPDQSLTQKARAVWDRLCPEIRSSVQVMHAGVECGIFSGKQPGLRMISYGPENLDIHTPDERVNVASAERMLAFTRELIEVLN